MNFAECSLFIIKWTEVIFWLLGGVAMVFGLPLIALLGLQLGFFSAWMSLFLGVLAPFVMGIGCYNIAIQKRKS